MKRALISLFAVLVLIAALPVSASHVTQMWKCEMNDDIDEDQVMGRIGEWVAAAKKLPGAENMSVSVRFPVAVRPVGNTDVVLVMNVPSFAEWGAFWDAYPESDAAGMEGRALTCPDSSLWETEMVE